jgi:hypothetical protein
MCNTISASENPTAQQHYVSLVFSVKGFIFEDPFFQLRDLSNALCLNEPYQDNNSIAMFANPDPDPTCKTRDLLKFFTGEQLSFSSQMFSSNNFLAFCNYVKS